MPPLLDKFIASFQKAITAEMEAMRQRLGPFEIPLAELKVLELDDSSTEKFYSFKILSPNDKLALQAECTLRCDADELLVTITGIEQAEVTLRSERKINPNCQNYTLTIYPWFLYEKLKLALEALLTSDAFFVTNALLLFGKGTPHQQPRPLQARHLGLNPSQRQAVQLCSDSNLAFIWGPPGTGKTTTLAHIVSELLSQEQRILITSTTNAAVDQALASLVKLADMQQSFERGQVVRIGQAGAETFGAGLAEVVQQLNAQTQRRLERLRQRHQQLRHQLEQCRLILEKLEANVQPLQLGLFHEPKQETLSPIDLTAVFSANYAHNIMRLSLEQQQALLKRRQARLETALALCQAKITHYNQELRASEGAVVQRARVILATMTNVYLSSLLNPERFDVVIAEEAGMAILPSLFYCAALARAKLIMVGDPKQLPPIVQSRDDYVYKAMGRNIFEIAAQNPAYDETVVMLDTQYRMHPTIGNLVSALFYDGKLRHGENTAGRITIAERAPYPGAPLVVLDTARQTRCAAEDGGFSRYNEKSAQLCSTLALEAVRAGVESVAIITPYVAQSRLIRQQLSRYRHEARQIDCQTVHRFQGGERDLVIFDTVDASPLPPGVLLAGQAPTASSSNLINVSISRARGKLIIISDVAYFQHHSPRGIITGMLAQAIQAGVRVTLS
jgi:superfamily I DNA and/or RNA helicase